MGTKQTCDQQNSAEDPAISPHNSGQLIFDKEIRISHWNKDSIIYNITFHTGWLHVEECK